MAHSTQEYGFALHKGDDLSLRGTFLISQRLVPSFDVNHAMICPKGGFPIIRHNEVRDITADLLTDDVELEPTLQPLTGERLSHRTANTEDGARLDVKARGNLTLGFLPQRTKQSLSPVIHSTRIWPQSQVFSSTPFSTPI